MVGVYIASLLERKVPLRRIGAASCKKHGFRVTSSEVAQAYHLLHQLSMTGETTFLNLLSNFSHSLLPTYSSWNR